MIGGHATKLLGDEETMRIKRFKKGRDVGKDSHKPSVDKSQRDDEEKKKDGENGR
jgi:hypothetical protein